LADRKTDGYPPTPSNVAAAVRSYWPWRFLGIVCVLLVIATIGALADAVVIAAFVGAAVVMGLAYLLAPWRQ
jgi:uncharacterized membrane protein